MRKASGIRRRTSALTNHAALCQDVPDVGDARELLVLDFHHLILGYQHLSIYRLLRLTCIPKHQVTAMLSQENL